MRLLLEVIVCSVADAEEAERGGAGRLEVVRDLGRGGLTPDPSLVARIAERTRLPLRVMIREQDDYAAGPDREELVCQARRMAALGVDGLVAGFLAGGGIDEDMMTAVMRVAPGVPVTFHHAFDELPDPAAALLALTRWPQIDRVLTAGGAGDWRERASRLARLAHDGRRGPAILPGGGVDVDALRILSRTPGLREAHVGRAAREPQSVDGTVDRHRVATLIDAMERLEEV